MGRVCPSKHAGSDPNRRRSSQDPGAAVPPLEGRLAPNPSKAVLELGALRVAGGVGIEEQNTVFACLFVCLFVCYKEVALRLGRASSHCVSQLNPQLSRWGSAGQPDPLAQRDSSASGSPPLWCPAAACPPVAADLLVAQRGELFPSRQIHSPCLFFFLAACLSLHIWTHPVLGSE